MVVAPARARRNKDFSPDSLRRAREERIYRHIDSAYIRKPLPLLTVRMRSSFSSGLLYSSYKLTDGTKNSANLHSDLNHTISAGVSYRGIGVSISLNPSRMFGYTDMEYNLTSYGNRFGGELNYFNSTSYTGYASLGGEKTDFPANSFTQNMLIGSFYYVFSHSRFSYPAALSQTYIQTKSKGSWLLALTFAAGNIRMDDGAAAAEYLSLKRNSIFQLGIGGGYAYNWVLPHHWLLHLSITPTIAIWEKFDATYTSEADTGDDKDDRINWPGAIISTRASLIHDFNRSWFAGLTFVSHSTLTTDDPYFAYYFKWRARIVVGVRVW